MSLKKAIQSGKEKRKLYTWDKNYRCDCSWCQDNRLHKIRKINVDIIEQIKEL